MQVTRRLILQKARHQATACAATPFDCLWARGFRYYFTPLPGCFSPFPHGTRSLSVAKEYLDLWGGPHRFMPVFTVPALLGMAGGGCVRFGYGAVTHCGRPFQSRSPTQQLVNSVVRLMPHLLVPRPRASNAIRLGTGTV